MFSLLEFEDNVFRVVFLGFTKYLNEHVSKLCPRIFMLRIFLLIFIVRMFLRGGLLFHFFLLVFLVSHFDVPNIYKMLSHILFKILMVDISHKFLRFLVKGVVIKHGIPFVDAYMGIKVEVSFGKIRYIIEVN